MAAATRARRYSADATARSGRSGRSGREYGGINQQLPSRGFPGTGKPVSTSGSGTHNLFTIGVATGKHNLTRAGVSGGRIHQRRRGPDTRCHGPLSSPLRGHRRPLSDEPTPDQPMRKDYRGLRALGGSTLMWDEHWTAAALCPAGSGWCCWPSRLFWGAASKAPADASRAGRPCRWVIQRQGLDV